MVLIKLNTRDKFAGLCFAILMVAACAVFIVGAVPSVSGTGSTDKSATAITQPTAQDVYDTVEPNDTAEELEPEDSYVQYYTEQDAIDIAKVLYHECRGVPSKTEQACVAWTVLNRVDKHDSTVYSIVRAPYQFAFYENAPVWNELLDLAYDVLERWNREKNGETDVGRVLPKEYTFFSGRNGHNYFRDSYKGEYNIWDYSLNSPYQDN